MNEEAADLGRLPGCSERCSPRWHDLYAHETYGARRERERQQMAVVYTGPLVIDLQRYVATVSGTEVVLAPLEWRLLAHLAQVPGRWQSRAELQEALWGTVYFSDNNHIALAWRLRQKLGAAGELIESGGNTRRGLRLRIVPPEGKPVTSETSELRAAFYERMAAVYDELAQAHAYLGQVRLSEHCERQAAALRSGGELRWFTEDDDGPTTRH